MATQATARKGRGPDSLSFGSRSYKIGPHRPERQMPQADPIVRADKVELVNDDFSGDKRRRVVEYIQEHWNNKRDITLTEIANETETSRQHVKNVLEDHFEEVRGQTTMDNNRSDQPVLPDRDGVDPELLSIVISAYRIGVNDGSSDEVEPGITEELIELAIQD